MPEASAGTTPRSCESTSWRNDDAAAALAGLDVVRRKRQAADNAANALFNIMVSAAPTKG
jgi:hypothetical protein